MTIKELRSMWAELEDVPVSIDNDGDTVIDTAFKWWPAGTSREAIWMWFDERCPNGVVRDLMHTE